MQHSFVVDTTRHRGGSIEVRPECLVIDLPTILIEPWEIDRADVVEVDWWSRTQALFPGTLRPHGPELARARTVLVSARSANPPSLRIWSRAPIPLDGEPVRRSAFGRAKRYAWYVYSGRPPPGAEPMEGLALTVLAHPLALKRSLERWGVVFPRLGSPG